MRLLFLLIFVFCGALTVVARTAAPQPVPPPGAIQLPSGYRHERLQGIDSTVGQITKEGGITIRYDIGRMAGNYAGAVKQDDRQWTISQVVNGEPVEIVKDKKGRLTVTFTDKWANFYAKVAGEEDVATFLAIVLTYPAPPAAK